MIDDNSVRAALIFGVKDFLTTNETISTVSGIVQNLPIIPEAAVAWENKNFDPAGKSLWCSVFYRPNTPIARTIGPGGIDEIDGFIQIDFNIQPDKGEGLFIDWNKKARLFFHGGRFFSHSGHSVIVTSSGMGQSRHVDNYFRQSLTVAFRSHLKRPKLN